MKKNLFNWSLLILSILFVACSSDDNSTPVEPDPEPEEPAEVGITSFGFYAEDNPEVLFNDYIVESIEESMTIDLPEQTALTALVARYTTTENDVVTVSSTTQESGVTANDFSGSVEFLVSEGDTNKIYTVTVGKLASAVWSRLGVFGDDLVYDISMAIDPTSSTPYVSYISDREDSDSRRLNLVGFSGDAWSRVGAQDFNAERPRSIELKYNSDGTPFISYQADFDDLRQIAITSYDNDWSLVGNGPYTGIKSAINTLAVDADNTVYGFFTSDERDENRRGLLVKTFSNGSWTDLPIPGRTGAAIVVTAKAVGNDVYLAVMNFGDLQSVSVYKYSNGSWSTIADQMKESPENTISYRHLAMDVDQNGNVYLAYAENTGEGTDVQLKVKAFSAENGTWSTLGDLIPTPEVRDFDVAVDNYGTAMLFYKNETETPVFLPFDNEVNNWGAPVVFETAEADELNLEIAPNGVAYAAYVVADQLYLHKFDSPDND